MKKLAIISSHPIQYNAPIFVKLSEINNLQVKVFYTWGQAKGNIYDPGFAKERQWDIPLLDGYDCEFEENTSKDPGSHHFNGIINPQIIENILQYNPHTILVFGWSFQSHLKVLRYFHGRKSILFRGDSTLLDEPEGFSLKKVLRRIFLQWVYGHIDYALYAGKANREYFLKHGVKPNQLIFTPHAIDNQRFYDANNNYKNAAALWRKELNIPLNAVVFLFAGKFEIKKDPFLLLKAFVEIKSDDVRLIMVGNGALETQLKEKAKNDKRIIFLDFQNQQNMPVVYRLCDIFVLPSKGPGETWGLAVNEAMACGKAVIVSNACGCADDLVMPGKNGLIIKAGDAEALTGAFIFFISNPSAAKEFGDKGQAIIKEWNYDAIIKSIRNIVFHGGIN